jgi:hypothetical protein
VFPFGVVLTVKRKGGRLALSPSGLFRVGFAVTLAVALFIFLFGVLFEGEGTPFAPANVVPLIFVLVAGLALLYNDAWIFDKDRGTVESQFGLLLLCRRKTFRLEDLREIGLESFRKGRLTIQPRQQAGEGTDRLGRGLFSRVERLVARDADGALHVLDSARATHHAALQRAGRRIAAYCGIPFREEA